MERRRMEQQSMERQSKEQMLMEKLSKEQLTKERPLFVVAVVLVTKLTSKKQPLIVIVVLAELTLTMLFPSLLLSEERLKVQRRLLLSKKIPVVFPHASGLGQQSMEKLSKEQLSMATRWMEKLSLALLLLSVERPSLRRPWLARLLSSQSSLSWTSWGRPERRP